MIELKRLKLINWHNFENVTFDCARLTYMIGVNAVGKTTILDAIRYCLTTNRNFNALGNKKSGRTLQGSVHAKQRGENAYRRPGRTVAYIGAEFWDSVKRTHFVIAVRVESEGPMQELHPGDQTWYISEDGCTLEQLPFIDPRTGAPSSKENFNPAVGRLSYTRSPGEARDRICRALGIGRAASPLGKKFNEVFQMGTSMDEIPNFREFLYQYILPQPELDLEALQGDRVELENLHAVLAEAQTRAAALEQIVDYGREAAQKETEALVNRGTALLARGSRRRDEHLAGASCRRKAPARRADSPLRRRKRRRGRGPPGLSFGPQCRRQRRGPGAGRPERRAGPQKDRTGQGRPGRFQKRNRRRQSAEPLAKLAAQRLCRRKIALARLADGGDSAPAPKRPRRAGKAAGRAVFRRTAERRRPHR